MITRNGWSVMLLGVVLLAAGLALSYREVVILGAGLLACVVGAVVSVRIPRPIEVTRTLTPFRVEEGEGAAGVITVRNPGSRHGRSVEATEHLAGQTVHVALPGLPPGGSHTESYHLPTDHRGCFTVGPLRIARTDPLRLASAAQSDSGEVTLWVHPKIWRVRPIPTGRADDIEGPANRAAHGGIAFHSLRNYEPGDDPRLIHWRSTARTGNLIVKHTVITNEPRLLIVLDTSSDSYEDDSFEDAVRVAASLVAAGADQRFPTDLRTTGGVSATIDPTGLGYTDTMDKLAAIDMTPEDPGLPGLSQLGIRREHGVALGVVTGQPAPDRAKIVGALSRRFQMVTLVQVGERFGRPGLSLSGVLSVAALDAEEFSRIWKTRIG